MFSLFMAFFLGPAAACPPGPTLRDADSEVTVLEQNLKFIATGGRRAERAAVLASWLEDEGDHVDLLLLSEARLISPIEAALPDWCFYAQHGDGDATPYEWVPRGSQTATTGLVMAVRTRDEGVERPLGQEAGRRFRSRPTSLAEGLLGRIANYHKGWAGLEIDGTRLVWSHTQASYKRRPERGAGEPGRGRAGQFEELAGELGHRERPLLLTGDLNLLDLFRPDRADHEERARAAREIDGATVRHFQERTGVDFRWPWSRGAREDAGPGTFAGGVRRDRTERSWDIGARYDRVGVNEAFKQRHPGTRVRPVEIARGELRVSDHLGIEITIPYEASEG